MRPVGSTSTRPRVGAPEGPDSTWRPRSARITASISSVVRRILGTTSVQAKAESAFHPVVSDAEDLADDGRHRGGVPAALGERAEQRHLGVLEPVDEVSGARRRPMEAIPQEARHRRRGRPGCTDQRGLVEAVCRPDRAPQSGHLAGAEPQHRRGQSAQLLAARGRDRGRAGRP